MSLALTLLGWLGALLAALLTLLIVVPLRARAYGWRRDGAGQAYLELRYLFGGVVVVQRADGPGALSLFGLRIRSWRRLPERAPKSEEALAEAAEKKAARAARRREKRKKKGKERKPVRAWLAWIDAHLGTAGDQLGRLLATFALKGRLEGRYGFDDPADTAALHATLAALGVWAPQLSLALHPDYLDPGLELEGELSAQVWPLAMAGALLTAALEPRTWKMIWGLR